MRFSTSVLAAAFTCALAAPAMATNVCGPITVNTTWNIANSPYLLTCDVRVLTGALLTIDPGVDVVFAPNTTLVAEGGQIHAIGTISNYIRFYSQNNVNRGEGVRVQGGEFRVDYGKFTTLNNGTSLTCCGSPFNPPLLVNHSEYVGNQNGISGYTIPTAQILNTYFQGNVYAAGQGYQHYSNCRFVGNTYGFQFSESITLEDCEFDGHQVAVSSPNGNGMAAYRCYFHDNILALENVVTIERCTIINNQTGVRITTPYLNSMQCNDIYQNDNFNVVMATGTTLNAPNNWWGTSIPSQIDAGIYDGFDQIGLGFLQYATPLSGDQAETSTCSCTIPNLVVMTPSFSEYVGQPATFTVNVTAVGTPTYQWKRNGVALANNGHFSGATTTTLTINPIYDPGTGPNWTDAGAYSCTATNVCGSATSADINLTVQVCGADFNNSGTVSVQDIFDFLAAYFAGCP